MLEDRDLLSVQEARHLCAAAHLAQKQFESLSQEQIDAVVARMAQAVLPESRRLAEMAVEETGFGKAEDKHLKNTFCADILHQYIRGIKTVGIIRDDKINKIVEIAVPVGVVCAIIPSTNPTSTTIYKTLIALKAGNAIVCSPHPAAVKCINETAGILRRAAVEVGAPEGILGCLTTPTLEATQELMRHPKVGVILATGGMGLVRAAYSSGKPAYGVGPGNVPAFIERTANVAKAVSDIFTGTCFDNGTLCSSEQSMIVDEPVQQEVIARAKELGGYFLDAAETAKLEKVVVGPDRHLNPKIVGKSAVRIAEMAGLSVPPQTRVLLIPLEGVGRNYPLSMEKLSPLLSFYVVKDWKEACGLCIQILEYGGLGHTLGLHCNDPEIILRFGLQKPAFRIIVNTNTALGAVGYTTNLAPSMTLGCGTLGGNITSDNISPVHLMHIKRLAYETRPMSAERPSPVASAVLPQREDLSRLVEDYVRQRMAAANPAPTCVPARPSPPAAPAAPPAVPESRYSQDVPVPTPIKPAPPPELPVAEFVCEDDVRRALNSGAKIRIGPKTLLTPSARELGEAKGVFITA